MHFYIFLSHYQLLYLYRFLVRLLLLLLFYLSLLLTAFNRLFPKKPH